MCWLYKDMEVQDRERVVKFLLCTVLGLAFSLLVGDTYSATTAVTANLFLYTDRGYYGGLRYAMKRIEVQVIQGLLVLMIVLPCRYWLDLPVPDTMLMILASCFAILIGLPLNYKHQISPYHTTLANATFIMATGTIHNLSVYPYRVLHCFVGFLIGYLVNYIIMPQRDRYQEAVKRARACTALMLDRVAGRDGPGGAGAYQKTKALLETDIKFLEEDSAKGPRRYRRTPEQLRLVTAYRDLLNILENVQRACGRCEAHVEKQFETRWRAALEESLEAHRAVDAAVGDGVPAPIRLSEEVGLAQSGAEEVLLAALVIEYRRAINGLSDTYNGTIGQAESTAEAK